MRGDPDAEGDHLQGHTDRGVAIDVNVEENGNQLKESLLADYSINTSDSGQYSDSSIVVDAQDNHSTAEMDDEPDLKEEVISLVRKVGGEAMASFLVVVTLLAVRVNTYGDGVVATLATSLMGGLAVMVAIFSLGHVSGSQINPAVTVAYTAIRHFPLALAPLYISAQLVGATIAALVIEVVFRPASGVLLVIPNSTDLQSVLAEMLAGFLLLFVASSVSTDTRAIGEFAGLAVGAIIAMDIMIVGPISGGGINPARVLGPAIVSWNFQYVWIYIVSPVIGGLLGALAYRLLRPEGVRKPGVQLQITRSSARLQAASRKLSFRKL